MRIAQFRFAATNVRRYGLAVVAVLAVVFVKLLLERVTEEESPFLLLLSAVMISAWYGGIGPGVLATLLAAVISEYFFLAPGRSLLHNSLGQNLRVCLFLLEALLISWLCALLHGAGRRAKASSHEARKYYESLGQSEAHFRLLVEGVKDYAILMLDTDGRVATWTAAVERMIGYRADEIVGRHFACLYPDGEAENAIPDRVLKTVAVDGRCEQEAWCVRKDGSRFWAEVAVAALPKGRGGAHGFSVVMRDITERKRAEEAHQQRTQELAEANRLKDEFLATMSHELRTPLNSILGWAQLLRSGKLDEVGRAHALETIEQNAKTLAQLIEDLLDISQMITGKMRLDVRAVQLVDVIEAAIEIVRPAADAKEICVRTMLDQVAGPVFGDPNRLQQVAWNLLSNAIKFTPRGGVVLVELEQVNSHVEFAVKDTGAGIKPNFLPYVFDAFRQADSSSTRSHKGLGLGLAIVRHLVELHGGTVRAESAGEGQGTMFRVKLPVASMHTNVRVSALVRPMPTRATSSDRAAALHGLRVLVVDDDPGARELLATVLSQWSVKATTAASADEGLALLQRFRPDVLLSDIEMPNEDGYALISKVRALTPEQGGRTPAVALTAYARPEDRSRTLAAGFQKHLAKPVEPDELAAAIASLAGEVLTGR